MDKLTDIIATETPNIYDVIGICDNKWIHALTLEMVVWGKVKDVLNGPERLINEYQSRISESKERALDQDLER